MGGPGSAPAPAAGGLEARVQLRRSQGSSPGGPVHDSPTLAPGWASPCHVSSGPPLRPAPSGAPGPMAGLNVSLSFFLATIALCQAARRASKALLPAGVYASFAREAAGAAQLGACCLELRMLAELGPWAGGFGPDLLLTLLFLLFLAHGATFDGASANPAVALQELLLAEAALPGTLLKLAAQALGLQAACALTRRYWAWELSDLHVLQNLLDAHCSSALRTTVPRGALVEGACAFFFHLSLLRLRHSLPLYRVPAVALLVTVTAYAGETWGPHQGPPDLRPGCGPRGWPGPGVLGQEVTSWAGHSGGREAAPRPRQGRPCCWASPQSDIFVSIPARC